MNNKLYIIIGAGTANQFIFKNIENEMEVIIIPNKLSAPKNWFLKITRFLFVGKFPLPLPILSIWFDKVFLEMLCKIKSNDHLLVFESINLRALGMIKHLVPNETKKYNWFGNPIYPLFKSKNPHKLLRKIEKLGFENVTFDNQDAIKYSMTYHNQFIRLPENKEDKKVNDIDFYFCGLPKDRENLLINLKKNLETIGFKCLFIIPHSTKEYISYEQNIEYVKRSKCIIDFYQEGQLGLTRRPIESLFYEKKLITNNPCIEKFDFYHPNNVHIFREINIESIIDFMKKEYSEISFETKKKYDVHLWLNKFMPK